LITIMAATLAHIYRYPVKSLSAEPLGQADLAAGSRLANDRRFAIAHGASRIDLSAPAWQPKTSFLALVRNERLAKLATRFDDATDSLTISRDGKQVCRGKLTDPIGRSVIEQFLAAFLGDEARGTPRIAAGHGDGSVAFTDVPEPYLSIIGLASIKDLERVARASIDPLRFRANFYVADLPPWGEFDWIGKKLRVGQAVLEIVRRIGRCAATEVHPSGERASGTRDMRVLSPLQSGFGHTDMGVYARVIQSGKATVGDQLSDA
jgi:uncharacterized protein